MKEDRHMSGLVTGSEAKVGVVEFVTAMSTNPPIIWTLGHDHEARAFTTGIVQPSPHKSELPGAANSGSENTSPSVEKALMLK